MTKFKNTNIMTYQYYNQVNIHQSINDNIAREDAYSILHRKKSCFEKRQDNSFVDSKTRNQMLLIVQHAILYNDIV